MRHIDFETYLDKVRGCFAGKAAIGTMGAPYEGVKMRMELKYRPEMTDELMFAIESGPLTTPSGGCPENIEDDELPF